MKTLFTVMMFVITVLSYAADDLQRARFTEVFRDVRVTSPDTKDIREAKVNDIFELRQVIRTGISSRAELEASDKTIARVGANTIFSFEAAKRTMHLHSGSVLFHSPKGMGGGTIRTAAATAAVTGTTIMVGATSNGGFKLLVLEGQSRVTHPSGDSRIVNAGQMTFVVPGQNTLGPVINFDLKNVSQGSSLLNGFKKEVSSSEKIDTEVDKQQASIKEGTVVETNIKVGDVPDNKGPLTFNFKPDGVTTTKFISEKKDFLKFSDFLDSHNKEILVLNNPDFSGYNFFSSNANIDGFYQTVFSFKEQGFTGALSALNLTFVEKPYNFSNLGTLNQFFFVAHDSITFNNSLSGMSFLNAPDNLRFISLTGSMSFSDTDAITSSSKQMSFEALNAISTAGSTVNFLSSDGLFSKITMESKNAAITLNNPTFNSKLVELRADRVNLNNFDITQFTGAKVMNVYTLTGDWFVSSGTPNKSGALNINDPNVTANTSGTPGSSVYRDTSGTIVNSNINSLQK